MKSYEKALRRAGDPAEPVLPAMFSRIFHSQKLLGFKNMFRAKTKGGVLTIDITAVSFESGSKNLSIPVDEIAGVSFAGFVPDDPDPWLVIIHGEEGDLVSEFFSGDTRYNKIFAALLEATGSD